MVFRIVLNHIGKLPGIIPVNYSYPLSSALYRIIAKGDADYAQFLHEKGYGKKEKGFKFFTFSQINVPFHIDDDRMLLLSNEINFNVCFHLPPAAESFIKGLFQSETIDIADKKSRASFRAQSVESLPNPLQQYKDNEIVSISVKPISPLVIGIPNEKGNYDYLAPDDPQFVEGLLYNWRSKIAACYDEETGAGALLMAEIQLMQQPPKRRLIWIKAGTPEETKIRGWLNFTIKLTGEKRFAELLLNSGAGLYNAMGMGCVEVNTTTSKVLKTLEV